MRVSPRLSLVAASLLMMTCGLGCASYEYDLVEPQPLAQHVGADAISVDVEPLRYRLITVDSYLVMRVFNETAEPVTLLGDESYVVDPRGQSHPLQSQTIAPGTFIKLVFPPVPPQVVPRGPTIGIGFGAYGHHWHRHPYYYGGYYYDRLWYDEPRYYTVYDPANNYYWEWDGEGTVARAVLIYRPGPKDGPAKTVRHEFAFSRVKKK